MTSVFVEGSVKLRAVKVSGAAWVAYPREVMVPATSTGVITGASLLPVILMVTSWVSVPPVSYTHLTLPTKREVSISAGASTSK